MESSDDIAALRFESERPLRRSARIGDATQQLLVRDALRLDGDGLHRFEEPPNATDLDDMSQTDDTWRLDQLGAGEG